jgi:hypothetical protein
MILPQGRRKPLIYQGLQASWWPVRPGAIAGSGLPAQHSPDTETVANLKSQGIRLFAILRMTGQRRRSGNRGANILDSRRNYINEPTECSSNDARRAMRNRKNKPTGISVARGSSEPAKIKIYQTKPNNPWKCWTFIFAKPPESNFCVQRRGFHGSEPPRLDIPESG